MNGRDDSPIDRKAEVRLFPNAEEVLELPESTEEESTKNKTMAHDTPKKTCKKPKKVNRTYSSIDSRRRVYVKTHSHFHTHTHTHTYTHTHTHTRARAFSHSFSYTSTMPYTHLDTHSITRWRALTNTMLNFLSKYLLFFVLQNKGPFTRVELLSR